MFCFPHPTEEWTGLLRFFVMNCFLQLVCDRQNVPLHIIFLDCKQDFGAGASMLWPFSLVGAKARISEKSEPELVLE